MEKDSLEAGPRLSWPASFAAECMIQSLRTARSLGLGRLNQRAATSAALSVSHAPTSQIRTDMPHLKSRPQDDRVRGQIRAFLCKTTGSPITKSQSAHRLDDVAGDLRGQTAEPIAWEAQDQGERADRHGLPGP